MLRKFIGLAFMVLAPGLAFADGQITGDAAAGEKVFRKCMACHQVGDDAVNKVGPILNGIIDRQVASVADFTYSDVLAEMGAAGKVWTVEEMDAFLQKPRDYAKGTKMSFAGLRKDEERANVIAYLASFQGEGS